MSESEAEEISLSDDKGENEGPSESLSGNCSVELSLSLISRYSLLS